MQIGGVDCGRVAVGVTALDSVLGSHSSRGGIPDADGILGSDLLSRAKAILDLRRGTLTLGGDSNDRAALQQRVTAEGYSAIPLLPTTGFHFAVPCAFGSSSYRLVVDTGSPGTVVERDDLGSANLSRPFRASSMKTLGGVTTVAWMPLQHWSIGNFPIETLPVATGHFRESIYSERTANGGQVAGLLGLEAMAHWRAQIDFGTRRMYLRQRESRLPDRWRDTALAQRQQPSSLGSLGGFAQQAAKPRSR